MAVYLVRHACAGNKQHWQGLDHERRLDDTGVRQAEALADALAGAPIGRIASSPAVRCRRSVEPLARRLGLGVELHPGLRREATPRELHDLLATLRPNPTDVVLCTHGELMRPLLAELRQAGVPIGTPHDDDEELLAKGTAWRLTLGTDGTVAAAEHLVPAGLPRCPDHPSS